MLGTSGYIVKDTGLRMNKLLKKLIESKDKEDAEKAAAKIKTLDFTLANAFQEFKYINNVNNINGSGIIKPFKESHEAILNIADKVLNAEQLPLSSEQQELYSFRNDKFLNAMQIIVNNIADGYFQDNERVDYYNFYCKFDSDLPCSIEHNKHGYDFLSEVCLLLTNLNNENKTNNVLFSNLEFFLGASEYAAKQYMNIRQYATYSKQLGDKLDLTARRFLEKVAIGSTTGYRVRNNSMNVVFHRFRHNPIYHTNYYDDSREIKKTQSESDIERLTGYLRKDGVLFFMIPIHLINMKFCTYTAKTYRLLWAACMNDSGINDNLAKKTPEDYVMLALKCEKGGRKYENIEATFQELTNLNQHLKVLSGEMALAATKDLPQKDYGEVDLLVGEEVDLGIISLVLEETKCKDIFKNEKPRELHPLLPLKQGQIGQILASGKLDGVIDEGGGFKHVIRGRVYKGHRTKTENAVGADGQIQQIEREYTNNLIEINLFAGDGTFKSIVLTNNQ